VSTAPLGEATLGHVVPQMVAVATLTPPRPARFHCPKRNQPRPSWLPPRQFCCPQDHYLQGTYGITCDQWWEQYQRQAGKCGICRRRFKPGQRVVVDHDHDTGDIDSLAHFSCNRGLRQEHRRYAKNPPGAALGLRVAPAKLKAIQAKDRAKRAKAQERRATARANRTTEPLSTLDKLRTMTRKGA
jgi:Recombination endonuclease VII